jgi:hypothetical protein
MSLLGGPRPLDRGSNSVKTLSLRFLRKAADRGVRATRIFCIRERWYLLEASGSTWSWQPPWPGSISSSCETERPAKILSSPLDYPFPCNLLISW